MKNLLLYSILLLIPLFSSALDQKKLKTVINDLKSVERQQGDILGYLPTLADYLREWHNVSDKMLPNSYYLSSRQGSRREDFDYFSLLSGGLAIRESLQLQSIRPQKNPEKGKSVLLSTLKGPQIKSHPFDEMLKGRTYSFSPLATLVPEDFYYFHTESLSNTLDLVDYVIQKGGNLYKRYEPISVDQHLKEKVLLQLGLKENKEARIFYDTVIKELAITGSDPFFRSGTDFTFIFSLKNAFLFHSFVNHYRSQLKKEHKATTKTLKIGSYSVELLSTGDRKIHAYLLVLDKETTILSNSLPALKKLLATRERKHPSLANAKDFLYMKSLYPENKQKNTFIYLSDAFIRYLVSPELRLSEARRLKEAQRLAALEKFALFYHHFFGKKAKTPAEIIKKLAPATKTKEHQVFFKDLFKGLTLASNGITAKSDHYGSLGWLKPILETKLTSVSSEEADAYTNFVKTYHDFWRTFFDPIGIRLTYSKNKLSLETHILPLINSSIYDSLVSQLGGKPAALPSVSEVPGDTISLHFKLSPEMKQGINMALSPESSYSRNQKPPLQDFSGLFGDSISFFMQDSAPMVDFDASIFLRESFFFRSSFNTERMVLPFLVWSLFHPLRFSIPLNPTTSKDTLEKTIDNKVLHTLQNYARFSHMRANMYKILYKGQTIRVFKVNFENIMVFRFYLWIDKALHLTTTESYIKKTIDAKDQSTAKSIAGNILFRFFPAQITQEKDLYEANFREMLAGASFSNLGTLTLFKRIFPQENSIADKIHQTFGITPVCPVEGEYQYLPDKKIYQSSVFGHIQAPFFKLDKLHQFFHNFFATEKIEVQLEFTPEGLHTLVEMK